MPEYLSPGVYVEEVDAGPKPIEGVSTSTAAAAGVTVRGPSEGPPVLVTSFNDFQRIFGGFYPPPDAALRNTWDDPEHGYWWRFPLAVKGFFDNGGQRLYIKRVVAEEATSAEKTFRRVRIDVLSEAAAIGAQTLKLNSLIGISIGASIKIVGSDQSFTVADYDPASREVTLDGKLTEVLAADSQVVVQAVPGDTSSRFSAAGKGKWGENLYVRTRATYESSELLAAAEPDVAGLEVNTTLEVKTDGLSKEITVAKKGIKKGDRVMIEGVEYVVTDVKSEGKVLVLDSAPPELSIGVKVRRMRPGWNFGSETTTLRVQDASKLYVRAVVEIDNGTKKQTMVVSSIFGDQVSFENNVKINLYEGHTLRVVEGRVDVRWRPADGPEVSESFTNLRLIDDNSPAFLVTRVNRRSKLIRVEALSPSLEELSNFPGIEGGDWTQLEGGDDKHGILSINDFIGGVDDGPGQRTGIRAFEEIDEISICTVPNMWAPSIHNALMEHCELLADRFAILDVAPGLDIEGVRKVRDNLTSSYAALYYPWVEVRDPIAKQDVPLAPSGHIAGIYARVDNDRGVHKAPANEVIRGISRIAQPVTKREQDMLNPKGINALRFFPGRGNRVWGARTLAADPSWKYINVRRLFLFIEESIDEATQWVVFEPNDEPLWARIRASITNFLTTVWRSGALQGASAEQAFFVKCDHTTMTQDDIDNGRLICVIGVAPVKPAEFVIFRIQQKTIEAEA